MRTKKGISKIANCMTICLILCLFFSSCQFVFPMNQQTDNTETDTTTDESEWNQYLLSNKICETIFGIDSQTFCQTKGKDTLLENGYTDVVVTADGELVLQLTDTQVDVWRNSDVYLQILQKIVGEKRKIVSQIIPPTDSVYGTLYENADVHCGFEISEDYSKIIAGPGDDKSYQLIIPRACIMMQILEGKPSDEILVEYLEVDLNGTVVKHVCFPMYMFMFQNLDECKQLRSYEQTSSEIDEYLTPDVDNSYNGLEYQSFWGMKYQSANLEYEIFAYEFTNKDNALRYYIDVTGRDDYADRIPLKDSDKNVLWSKTIRNTEYQIIVIEGNKAYKILASNSFSNAIDKMLSDMFSVKV